MSASKTKVKVPSIYLFVYKLLKEQSQGRIYINYDSVREVMRRRFHKFPKYIHYIFLKEMEEYNLIKRNGNTKNITYQLVGKNIDKLLNQYKFPF